MRPHSLILTVAALALAASGATAAPLPPVARIVVQERGGIAFGSGTLIDKRDGHGLVITNWHVVKDASGKIEVVFPDGFRSEARAIKLDEDWDLAALVIWSPPTEPVRISPTPPRPGDPLTICGYGQGEYREATGRCTDFYAPEVGLPHELVELSVEARQGDSGGPILNERGELAGVLFGAANGTTLGSFSPRVETFLASVLPGDARRGGALGAPSGIPTTPALIAHAPPSPGTTAGQASGQGGGFDANRGWQTLAGPRDIAAPTANSGPVAPAARPDEGRDSPWPEPPVAKDVFAASGGRPDGYAEWKPADGAPAVAAIPAIAAGGDLPHDPPWHDTLRNVLAVVGVTFLFLHLVRIVS